MVRLRYCVIYKEIEYNIHKYVPLLVYNDLKIIIVVFLFAYE